MSMTARRMSWVGCVMVALLLALPAAADFTYGADDQIWSAVFTNLSNTTSLTGAEYEIQAFFDLDVGNQVMFRFLNNGADSSTGIVTDVYWDESTPDVLNFASGFSVDDHWDPSAHPQSFEGGAPAMDDPFVTQYDELVTRYRNKRTGKFTYVTSEVYGSADVNKPKYGIEHGESADFVVGLNSADLPDFPSLTYPEDLLARLVSGDLRVGIHVQSIPNGSDSCGGSASEWFYAPGPSAVVPVPAAAGLGLLGMGLLGWKRRAGKGGK